MLDCAFVVLQHMSLSNSWPETIDTKARNLSRRKRDVATGKMYTNLQVLFTKDCGLQRHISFNCLLKIFFLIPRTDM